MYPTKVEQATIFIIDVGRNVSTPEEKDQKSFFDNAREFSTRLIERMIISQVNSWVGVMLLGSKKTKNNMAEQCEGAYKHIDMVFELGPPTWQMIRDMPDKPSNSKGDWVDALIVAAEHLKNLSGVKITHKKIILMTNFKIPTTNTSKDVEMILEGFKDDKYEVDIIGPNLDDDSLKGADIELAKLFLESTNGQTASFEYAMQYLLFHRKRAISAKPWNIDLSIGPNIKIPVSSYLRIKDEPVVKRWTISVKDPITSKSSTTEGIMKPKVLVNTENQDVVEEEKTIKGYHYGQNVIPMSDCDKTMLYESGDRCLSVYGFTNYSDINWQSLNGDSLSYVFGRKGDKKAQNAIRCLVECLHETGLVGIVRRVYMRNNAPKMFALFPVIDSDNYICLSMAAVCFKEDIKYMSFPSTNLKKYACSEAQVGAFKDLIKAMDLTRAYDDSYDDAEAFPVARTVSPFAQYMLDCIAFRAMNPGKPLPKPREEIMNLFKVPSQVEARAKEPLEKLKSLLVLNKVEKKQRKKKVILNDDPMLGVLNAANDIPQDYEMPKINLPSKPEEKDVVKITTVDPISDYRKLKSKQKKLAELAPEMISAIEDLMYCNLDGDYGKAFEVMSFFRKECVADDPTHYNNWLQKFKADLNEQKKGNIVNLISDKNVNFILKSENGLSTFETEDSHDDTQMYENDTIPNTADLTIQSEINDMFDQF